ncbi:MAG TPA: creatininase family protein [Pseudonocardiaceae bacterium]|nr:creatininase family protein [Pseudonocardiaceae bacterium]
MADDSPDYASGPVLRWAELNREQLTAALPQALVILPIGATEQHGPHLATGTDALLASTVAGRAAAMAAQRSSRPLLLTPTLPIGASDHHFPFGGTLSFRQETLLAVLGDLARSVARCGGLRLVLVNGHGGNQGICQAAAALAATEHGLAVACVDYWRFASDPGGGLIPGHAGEFETSMVLAVDPELAGAPTGRLNPPIAPAVPDTPIHSAAGWQAIDGYTDDPARADADRGKRWLNQCVRALADRLVSLAQVL